MIKLIIADDMEAMCVQLRQCIEGFNLGIQVSEVFSNGQQVIDYLEKHHVDIVLTDIKMPAVSGLDVAEYVYTHCPETKVVIMSAYSDFEYAKQAIRFRVFDYLQKAINLEELRTVLVRVSELIREEEIAQDVEIKTEGDGQSGFLTEILAENQINQTKWDLFYPKLSLNKAKVGFYRLMMKNYRQVMENRWKYESERLIDAIYGIVRMTLMEKKVLGVELLDYSEKSIDMAIISGREFRFPAESVKSNLENFAGLFIDCVNVKTVTNDDEEENERKEDVLIKSEDKLEQPEDSIRVVEQAKKFVREHIGQSISRSDVAHFCGYSVSHFSRLFTGETGMSISKYIFDVRMEKVIELLNTDMKIKEIAAKTGYHDTRQLRRNLEMYTGMTPVEYRKKILNRNDEDNS